MAFIMIFFIAFSIIFSFAGLSLFNIPPINSFLTNLKQSFGIAEPMFDLQIPPQVYKADHFIPGAIVVKSEKEEEILDIKISLVECVTSHRSASEESQNRTTKTSHIYNKKTKKYKTYTESKGSINNKQSYTTSTILSSLVITESFITKPNKSKKLNFELPFNVSSNSKNSNFNKYINRDEFVFLRVMNMLASFSHKQTLRYYVQVSLNVKDKWTTPKKSKIITLI